MTLLDKMKMPKATKKLAILGSTGSIGKQTLEVLQNLENQNLFEVVSMSAGNNIELFIEQIKKVKPKKVCIKSEIHAKELKSVFPKLEIFYGDEGIIELARDKSLDIMLTGTSGKVALKPTVEALKNGTDIALANKETLIMAGDIVMFEAKKNNAKILPVDSEHSAILQCAENKLHLINKIIITASGGPFLHKTKEEIAKATFKDALKHPKWNMGKKITIDSSTLMNKGLEVIEAHHLFNIPYEKIEVVVHPQSIVHSAVEYIDGSVIAQLGLPSMHLPIQYALTYPNREYGIKTKSFNFINQNLTFEQPDFDKFPCLKLAFDAGKEGGTMPVVLNASNEVAVHQYLKGLISINDIYKIVEKSLCEHKKITNPTLDEIFSTDIEIREKTYSMLSQ